MSAPATLSIQRRSFYLGATLFEIASYLLPLVFLRSSPFQIVGILSALTSFVLLVEALARPDLLDNVSHVRLRYLFKVGQSAGVLLIGVTLLPGHSFFPLLLFVAVLYMYLNLLLREPRLPIIVAGYLIIGTTVAAYRGWDNSLQALSHGIMALATLFLILGHRFFVSSLRADLQSAEVREATHRSLFQFLRFSTKMVAHDVNNFLMLVAGAAEKASLVGEVQLAEELDRTVSKIHDSMRILQLENRTNVPLISVLEKAMHGFPGVDFRIATDLTHVQVVANRHLLVGILQNIFSNAQEAWIRRQLQGILRVRIYFDFPRRELVLEDNAGGFDLHGIVHGNSEKVNDKSPHGIFLRSMMDPGIAALLFIQFRIERLERYGKSYGTLIGLSFLDRNLPN